MKVYEYDVEDQHCREGIATEEGNILFDSFWGGGYDRHRLTPEERKSARFLFDTDDFDELDRYSRGTPSAWSERALSDRAQITSQHRLQSRWFIRKGSSPDYATRLDNAERSLERAEAELRSSQWRVDSARKDVEDIRAEDAAPTNMQEQKSP